MYDLYDLGRDNKGPGVDISCRRAVTASVQVLAVARRSMQWAKREWGAGSWKRLLKWVQAVERVACCLLSCKMIPLYGEKKEEEAGQSERS
jgi:hypothetical protein